MKPRSRVWVAAVFGLLAIVIADNAISSHGWHGTRWRDCAGADSRRYGSLPVVGLTLDNA
jgi:hypothetical protein